MNILIVASKRSGGYTISNWIQKELASGTKSDNNNVSGILYDLIINPSASFVKEDKEFYDLKNTIVLMNYDEYKQFVEKNTFFPEEKFDFTVCLKRKGFKEQAESILFNIDKGILTRPYIISKEWLKENEFKIIELTKQLEAEYVEMSTVFGLHITYESLFSEDFPEELWNLTSYLGLSRYHYWSIKPNFKFRRNNIALV
jgi:hypothetical protein